MGSFPHNGTIGQSQGEQQTVPTHQTLDDVIRSVNMATGVVTAPNLVQLESIRRNDLDINYDHPKSGTI